MIFHIIMKRLVRKLSKISEKIREDFEDTIKNFS